MLKTEEKSLKRVTKRLKNLLGENLITVIAFGSRVTGDYYEESDFDVLVVVKERDYNLIKAIIDIFLEEEEKTSIPYSVIIKDSKSFEQEKYYETVFLKI